MPDDLAATAVDAATARKLEELSSDAQHIEGLRTTLLDLAHERITKAFGEDAAKIARYEYEQRGQEEPDRVLIELAGVKLELQHRGWLRALVTCPLCNAWDQHGRDTISDLADLGEILTHAAQLHEHAHPETGQRCDGLRLTDAAEERESWRVAVATTAAKLYEQLNLATEAGYAPQILTGSEGFVIVGKRIGSRFNKHLDQLDHEEPF